MERLFDDSVSTIREIVLETTELKESQLPNNIFFTD